MSSLLLFLLVLLLFASFSVHCLSSSFQSFQLINHVLLVDDKIFVGTVNNVSILSASTLVLQHSISTGPVKDSPLCSHDGTSCLRDARPKLTDTHNKLLALTPSGLLVCGSTRLGTCSVYSSTDLSLSRTGDVPVVGNSPESSSVWLKTRKGLIVAASPTSESPYRDPFPAVSLRMLSDLSIANSGSLEGEAAVYLREEYRSLVRYITSFQHGHFVYIAAVQGRKPVTKLIRFCANDTRFISYSEIELQCRSEDNSNYPELTAATLEGDRLIASFSDSSYRRSALCVFPMSRLALTYWYNLDRCRGGSDSIGLPHIGRDKKCTNKSRMPLSEDTCEMGVGGSIESVQVASWESRGTVTAMAATERVVVTGMKDGSLVKLKWGNQQQLEKYAGTTGGDESIRTVTLKDMKMLIQTDHEIRWIPLADCSGSTTCTSCFLSEDPLCQWCHSTNQCQTSSSCPTAIVDVCPAEDGPPIPSNLPVGTRSTVFLPVKNLPQPSHYKYECLFGQSISEAIWSEKGVRCAAPSISLTNGQKQLVLKLRTSLSSHHILQYNYSFYDCQQLNTCGECVQMEGCDWCSSSGQCQTKGSCSGDSSRECARIVKKEVLLAADVSKDLELEVVNVNKLPKTGLTCRLNKNRVVNASLEGKTVVCKGVKLEVNSSNQTVPIELLRNGLLVDVSQVSVYDCSFLAADCSSCAALEQKWSCGWCSGRCSASCAAHSASECDRPHISSFHPHSGPQEGGTVITISGRDLGTSIEDVRDRVFVGGSKCQVIGYDISRTIRCVVEKGTSTGSVRVAVGRSSKRTAETRDLFSFVEVGLKSIFPLFAPVSGGTKLSLYGSNLNSGSNVTINVGSIPCPVIHRNTSKSLTCLVGSVPYPQTVNLIELTIDAATVKMTTSFEFRPDPVVSSIRPVKVWKSGGKPLVVEGKNFDSVSSAKTYLLGSSEQSAEVVSETSSCQIVNSTTMYCLSPRLVHSDRTSLKYSRYPIGFAMDAVSSVRNLGPRIQLSVTPDPQLTPFHGTRVHQSNQPLILDGVHLNEAANTDDYKIFIGKERCYVTLVDSRQLVCNAPVEQPEPTDENGVPVLDAPLVTVTIGRVRTELGLLEYSTPMHMIQLWLPVVLLLLALMFVLLLFFCLWRRKNTEKERDYRKIQLQLEELEGTIRKECKTAFAELHTAMSFNLEDNGGAEVNSLKEFVNRLLWMDGSPSSSPSLYATRHPLTLAQFDSLLSTKHFIFAIVDAADADPSVSLQEKSLLSSLLVQALLRNFHYFTVVMTDLLRAHIAKTVHNGNAGLLFRSSESLVEKLVGKWLSIAMYPYVVDNQAHSFLQLYKALKCQAERGPVDEITGKARYTLNESMLLREAVDSISIDLLVMDLKGKGPFMLKVQSCDSIGQIKSKLLDIVYKGIRYSHRPSTRTFDLEWHCPRRGPVTLTETDHSSRRLNTLERFGVPPGALLLMCPGPFEHRNSDSGQCSWSSMERAPSATPSLPGLFHLTQLSGQTMDKRKKIDDTIPKNIPEVYLTRLLTSKTTVQNYIEDLLEGAVYSEETGYPAPLKFIFDLLDEEAARNGVEAAVAHQWKSNLYALRFWAVLLNRPRLLFDVPPTITVEADLTVVSQTLVDCFSSSEPTAGLSSSRLLFSKEVGRIRQLVGHFMERISRQPLVDENCLAEHLNQLANELSSGSSTAALAELLDSWIRGNGLRIAEVLSADPACLAARLPQRLSQIVALDSQPTENIYSTISEYAA